MSIQIALVVEQCVYIIQFKYNPPLITVEKQCYSQALYVNIGTVQVLFSDLCGFALSCLADRLTLSPTIFHPVQDMAVQRSLATGLYCCHFWLVSYIHTQSLISLLSRSICVQVKILICKGLLVFLGRLYSVYMLQVFLLLSFPANFVNCSLCWFRYVSHHILIYYILIHPYCSCHCHHMGKIRRFGPPWSLKVIFGCPLLISLSYTHKINILSSLSN